VSVYVDDDNGRRLAGRADVPEDAAPAYEVPIFEAASLGAPLLRRRIALGSTIVIGLTAAFAGALAGKQRNVRVGAIRWDAWYGQTLSPAPGFFACGNLAPPEYERRAPWFSRKSESGSLFCDGNRQEIIDAEIAYAAKAGIRYWAYVWYKQDSPMLNAWNLHQRSARKNDINWTIIVGYGQFHSDIAGPQGSTMIEKYLGYFREANFEKVLDGRPLVYLFRDRGAAIRQVADDLTVLRSATNAAGTPSPYVVVMSGNPSQAASDAAAVNADAISSYAIAPPGNASEYAVLHESTRSFWERMAATGMSVVPIGMTGWDRRPRIERPVPWEPFQMPFKGMSNHYKPATPTEIADHVGCMLAWAHQNEHAVPTRTALIYAWNESDEGGWLIPTWTESGPDTSRLEALSRVLR
jgi:hypothetical protein